MAAANKAVTATIRLSLVATKASPSPPIGPALGQHGLNIMDFCKDFNAKTQVMKAGVIVPVSITVYKDRTFTWTMSTPPVTYLIKDMCGLAKGSSAPGKVKVGVLTLRQVYAICELKRHDAPLSHLFDQAICRSIIGTARSMGVTVMDDLSGEATPTLPP